MIEYITTLNELQFGLLCGLIVSVFSPIFIFLFLAEDKPRTREETRRENEINAIYFSILSELEQKKYLAKHNGE